MLEINYNVEEKKGLGCWDPGMEVDGGPKEMNPANKVAGPREHHPCSIERL